ncbi:MAG: T9SS type A sorting domain-containing protein [Bacteroidales bacterium]|nr:T9SS type A sorting domain-containing protein [Bacteroidales bacterium]MBR6227559.1 T9SS type A sorting domain-containing protein [Bacteroidales bacterium]
MKKILLLMVAALFLCGVTSAQNWGTPDSHAKSSNTPIVAKVTLGETVQGAGTLGAFVGDELRGLATIHTDGNFWIQAFYNEGETNPDEFTFKFYDGEQEYTNCTTTLTGQEEGYGTPNSPVELVFANEQTMTQTTVMASGWNWWSTPIDLSDNGLQMLKNGLGVNGRVIKSRSGGSLTGYLNDGAVSWYGSLSSISNDQMYMIKTDAACEVEMAGRLASSNNIEISINNGWNWIGYPLNVDQTLTEALTGFTPTTQDVIKGRHGSATYYGGSWYGTLNNYGFEAGQGYMYKSNSTAPRSLTYHLGRGTTFTALADDLLFTPQIDNYPYNMVIMAVVEMDGQELRSEDFEIAAFVNDECRGSVKLMYVDQLDRYEAFLLVFGDSKESMRFVLTDGINVDWSTDHMIYSNDDIVGTITDPIVLHFSKFGMNADEQVFIYPNPSNGIFTIQGKDIRKVEVFDTYGQVILSKEVKSDHEQIDLSNNPAAVYFIRVITEEGIITKQLIKE